MIVFSDLHLREESEKTVFEQVFPGLFAAASKDFDKTLVCLGDFFHLRYRVPVHLQNQVLEFLEALERSGIRLLLLPGNHDQINIAGENALEVFRRFPNVEVFTEPTWNDYGYWIPYRKNPEDIAYALEQGAKTQGGRPAVLWLHHGVRGAYMSPQVQDTEGLPVDYFKGWFVLCGHYHMRQKVGSVYYIGSPYQTTASEAGQEKGYAVWKPSTFELAFANMDWGKRYHNLGVVNGEVDLSAVRPGDEIRAVTPPGVDPQALGKSLEVSGAKCVITPQVEIAGGRLPVKEGSGLGEYAREYVEQFAGTLDKDKLLVIYKNLCE